MELKKITTYNESYAAFIDHPLQSWAWGEAREKLGTTVFRFGIFETETLIAWYQMSLHHIPKTKFSIGYIPRSHAPSQEHIELFKAFAHQHNIIAITFEPLEDPKKNLITSDFKESFMTLLPKWTQMIDLTKSEEQLLKDMDAQARYNIRLAERKGVTISEESTTEGFETFWKLYEDTEKRQGYLGHSYTHHKTIWDTLSHGIAHLFIATVDSTPIAGFETFVWKDTLYYPYGGSDAAYQKLKGPNLGIWNLILFGKRLGLTKLDLWGSLGPGYAKDHPWAGFTGFKETFGTKFHAYGGTYDLIVLPSHYTLYKVLFGIRKQVFKIYNLFTAWKKAFASKR